MCVYDDHHRGPLREERYLRCSVAPPGWGVRGAEAAVGRLGLVEFDVDRPRSRATDGHSVNAARKTKNHRQGMSPPGRSVGRSVDRSVGPDRAFDLPSWCALFGVVCRGGWGSEFRVFHKHDFGRPRPCSHLFVVLQVPPPGFERCPGLVPSGIPPPDFGFDCCCCLCTTCNHTHRTKAA